MCSSATISFGIPGKPASDVTESNASFVAIVPAVTVKETDSNSTANNMAELVFSRMEKGPSSDEGYRDECDLNNFELGMKDNKIFFKKDQSSRMRDFPCRRLFKFSGIEVNGIMDKSYPRQLVSRTTRTQDNSYHGKLAPKATRTQDDSYLRQPVTKTTRTQDNSYPEQLVPNSLAIAI